MEHASVLVVYPFLQHYRRGVFLELDRTEGLDVTFAADTHGREGIECMEPSELRRFHRIRTRRFFRAEVQTGLRKVLSEGFDSVIFYGDVASVSTWIAASYARLKGMHVYFWTIGWHRPESGLKRRVRLAFYRLAHNLLVYGHVGRDIGVRMGFPDKRISVIGNSISLEQCLPLRGELRPADPGDEQTLKVGAVARLTEVKQFGLLVDACRILRNRGVNIQIKLAGSGPCRDSLGRQAARASVPIDFAGPHYSGPALTEFYEDLDVTVVPHAIGLTAIQSLGYGVPVISDDDIYTQMPEWESILPGVTGDTYSHGDPVELAEAILRVASWKAPRAQIGQACATEYATRWSPTVHANNIAKILGL